MRKSILAVSALALWTLAACKTDPTSKFAKKWQVSVDFKDLDSAFASQISSADTLTAFPPEFAQMRAVMDTMSAESRAQQIPPDMLDLLSTTNLDSFKAKLKASLRTQQQQQKEMLTKTFEIFDFQKNGIIRHYITDNADNVDTSMAWKVADDKKNVILFANPAAKQPGQPDDTVTLNVLHISADSFSFKTQGKNVPTDGKPMNLILVKDKK